MALSRPLSELPDSVRGAQSLQQRSLLPCTGWQRTLPNPSWLKQRSHRLSQELHHYVKGVLLSKRQVDRQIKCLAAPASPTLPLPAIAPVEDTTDTVNLRPMPKNVENLADDPSIANPLQVNISCIIRLAGALRP